MTKWLVYLADFPNCTLAAPKANAELADIKHMDTPYVSPRDYLLRCIKEGTIVVDCWTAIDRLYAYGVLEEDLRTV